MVTSAQVPNIPSVFDLVEVFSLKWEEKAAPNGQNILSLDKTKAINFDAQYLWLIIGCRPDEDGDFSDTDVVQICVTNPGPTPGGSGRYCGNWNGAKEYPGGYLMLKVPGQGIVKDQKIFIASKSWQATETMSWLIDVWILKLNKEIITCYVEKEHT